MAKLTDEELSRLQEFETVSLIRAIDDLDSMRALLNDWRPLSAAQAP